VFEEKMKKIYFLAICGTAMASLAAMFKKKGYEVYGSDEGVYPPMSTFLEEHNIPVYDGFDPSHLSPKPDVVVVGNVISRGNVELEELLDLHIPYISLPNALAEFFIKGKRSIVVTGTHGKTTTSSILSWIFDYAEKGPSFMIGGIPNNFGRGFQVGNGKDFIIEGDEYDSAYFDKAAKFLRYMPDVGIINSIEFDHADIYNSIEEIELAFQRFVNLIPRSGLLFVGHENARAKKVSQKAFCPVQTFGLNADADWVAQNISVGPTDTQFDVLFANSFLGRITVPLLGNHNIRNSLVSIAVSHQLGIKFETIQKALTLFKGVKRRLELKGEQDGIEVYDDFGHHPTAIKETLDAFRLKYPDRKIWALFEPRTATTRRDIFQAELPLAFENANAVLIAPVNRPDKAPKGHTFSPPELAKNLKEKGKIAVNFSSIEEIVNFLVGNVNSNDLIITFSNGFFGGIHEKILNRLIHN
jgi:UDP-N-acetylmuramate: L-alanyl-gamma-D-glutamyl-meso-diaminopimelate ligase